MSTLKNIFFSGTLRVFLVFLLLVISCTSFAVSPFLFLSYSVTIALMVLNAIIFFHHWFSMILFKTLKTKPKFGSFVDFVLVVAECTTVLYFLRPWNLKVHSGYMSGYIVLICAIWVQTICLCVLLMIRFAVIIANVIDKPSAALAKPFDFFAMSNSDSNIDRMIDRLYSRSFSRDGPPIRDHDDSEIHRRDQHWLVILRSSGIVVVAISLIAVLFTNLVLEPVHETGTNPLKVFTTRDLPSPLAFEVESINWSIISVFFDFSNEGINHQAQDAIQVKALWADESDTDPQCNVTNFGRSASDIFGTEVEPYIRAMEFGCPDRLSPAERKTAKVIDYLMQPASDIWPDLLIIVNFTTLGIDATSLSNYGSKTVLIVVGLHDNTVDILRNTVPIPLLPDAHLLGGVVPNVRYQYSSPKFASLGAFSPTRNYMTSLVPFLMPDPSLNIPRDNNTATLRLYMQTDTSDWRVSTDYREKSILAGISAVGGFWTVANGIFATIFGTTLWWVLFGAKPLSAFGLIHKIPKFKPVLEDEREHGRYPKLLSDSQSDGGLLDYVHDHFVDLGPFESNRAGSARFASEEFLGSEKV